MSRELAMVEADATRDVTYWLAEAHRLEIHDADDAQAAADFLTEDIAPRRKAVEDFFAPLVAAAHAAHKALTTKRAEITARFEEPERVVKAKLAAWRTEENQRQQLAAEVARITRAQAGGVVVLPPAPEPDKLAGVAFVETVKGECHDIAALITAAATTPSLIPLLQVNQKALDQMAKALGSALNVPGCRVVTEQTVRRSR